MRCSSSSREVPEAGHCDRSEGDQSRAATESAGVMFDLCPSRPSTRTAANAMSARTRATAASSPGAASAVLSSPFGHGHSTRIEPAINPISAAIIVS